MPIETIDDWEMRIKRQDAFWRNEVLDRPVVCTWYRDRTPVPVSDHESPAEKWLDVAFQVESALFRVEHTVYGGDALPIAFPNIGPDFFPACYGGELHFQDTTSYIEPFLEEWPPEGLSFDFQHPYFQKMEDLYRAYLQAGQGRFYVGWPDLHPGADCLVGLRGPAKLSMDLYDQPEQIKKTLQTINRDFLRVYDYYTEKLSSAQQPSTGWPGIVSSSAWHVTSNDFAYMISREMFDDFFRHGIAEEAGHAEAAIHHLDGPGNLTHLESILDIPQLNAVQYVYGTGNGPAAKPDNMEVYRRCQEAGKGVQIIGVSPHELDSVMEYLRPEGVWLQVPVDNADMMDEVLKKVKTWT